MVSPLSFAQSTHNCLAAFVLEASSNCKASLKTLHKNWAYDPDICATVDIRGICPGIQRRYPGH